VPAARRLATVEDASVDVLPKNVCECDRPGARGIRDRVVRSDVAEATVAEEVVALSFGWRPAAAAGSAGSDRDTMTANAARLALPFRLKPTSSRPIVAASAISIRTRR